MRENCFAYHLTLNIKVSVSLRSYIHSYAGYEIAKAKHIHVSVSLRSYIHSYNHIFYHQLLLVLYVSVSLRSYIHSYMAQSVNIYKHNLGFRLLTELYSFLFLDNDGTLTLDGASVSVSLRSYIHSYKK